MKSERGVTLIELMVVIVIVGLLAAVATVGYERYRKRALASEAQANLALIAVSQEAYKAEIGSYANVNSPNPAALPPCGSRRGQWSTAIATWNQLGWRPENSNVAFQYDTWAGVGAGAPAWAAPPPAPGNFPCFPTTALQLARGWFAATATADLACGGVNTEYRAVHCTSTLVPLNEFE